MAHEIDRTTGRSAHASTEREWHFGDTQHAIILPGDNLDTITAKAGLGYKVERAYVRYALGRDDQAISGKVEDKVVLFRDDTKAPLGVVSDGYKVVQPREVVQFFGKWIEDAGITFESAGALFDGRRYFATAKIAAAVQVVDGDFITPYVLLSTSADGSLATEARWTSVRTVCNNTLSAARRVSKATHRTTHRSVWSPDGAREAIEAANAEFDAFVIGARALAQVRINSFQAAELTRALFDLDFATCEAGKAGRGFDRILALFQGEAKGNDLPGVRGTGWGWINAVTEYVDHDVRARSDDHRFASAQSGPGAALKAKALALVAA